MVMAQIIWQALSSLANHHSSQAAQMMSLKNNKAYYDYTNKKDLKNSITLMKKEAAIQKNLMSNSAKATQSLNQNLMDYQYALERQSRQTSFHDTRMDLEGAGYNPLLAIGQQSNYTPVSSGVSAQSEGMENSALANSASDIVKKFNDMRNANELTSQGQQNIDMQRINSRYSNDLNSAKAEHERSETRGQDLDNAIKDLYGYEQAKANLDLTRSQENQINKAIEYTTAQIENMAYQNKLVSAQTTQAYASAQNQYEQAKYNKERSRGYVTSEGADKGSFGINVGPFGFKVSPGKYNYHVTR